MNSLKKINSQLKNVGEGIRERKTDNKCFFFVRYQLKMAKKFLIKKKMNSKYIALLFKKRRDWKYQKNAAVSHFVLNFCLLPTTFK